MKNPKSFSIISSYLLLENRFKIKLLMNFEPVLKRAVVCFFDPCATVYSRKSWGVLGTNLVSSAHVKCTRSFSQPGGRSRNMVAASTGFPSAVIKVLLSF